MCVYLKNGIRTMHVRLYDDPKCNASGPHTHVLNFWDVIFNFVTWNSFVQFEMFPFTLVLGHLLGWVGGYSSNSFTDNMGEVKLYFWYFR